LEINLKDISRKLSEDLQSLQDYIQNTVDVNLDDLYDKFNSISTKVNNITSLIQVSTKENNALYLITDENNPGLYVPNLSDTLTTATSDISELQTTVDEINKTLPNFVTKDDLGGGDFDFVNQTDFNSYTSTTN
jgi:ABC-type Zn uptake system ZnuABC Zn-binding protein ZnuA